MYFNPRPPFASATEAWLDAARLLRDNGPTYGLILHVTKPMLITPTDDAVISEVDQFLRANKSFPIATVANTIFPKQLYGTSGADALYERYRKIFPRIKHAVPDWGRYFERMINWPNGNEKPINQLDVLIEKLKASGPDGKIFRPNMFEVALYDPARDRNKFRGRQCLSLLEFKPERTASGGVLHMTAIYRSHYYVAKALGNFIGLGQLLAFVAREAGLNGGSLTVHSTYAELDRGITDANKNAKAWGITEARSLVDRCLVLSQQAAAA
ncbi:MAG TPA: hypothetical protein DHW63_00240 [Hyphomonadaceae bacterium]|nr:hypothetical protein [Hyphomonadaceae bacterium]